MQKNKIPMTAQETLDSSLEIFGKLVDEDLTGYTASQFKERVVQAIEAEKAAKEPDSFSLAMLEGLLDGLNKHYPVLH